MSYLDNFSHATAEDVNQLEQFAAAVRAAGLAIQARFPVIHVPTTGALSKQ